MEPWSSLSAAPRRGGGMSLGGAVFGIGEFGAGSTGGGAGGFLWRLERPSWPPGWAPPPDLPGRVWTLEPQRLAVGVALGAPPPTGTVTAPPVAQGSQVSSTPGNTRKWGRGVLGRESGHSTVTRMTPLFPVHPPPLRPGRAQGSPEGPRVTPGPASRGPRGGPQEEAGGRAGWWPERGAEHG